jgi:hypothetical protein
LARKNRGSRSGRQMSDALLEQLLVYKYSQLTRTSLVTVNNDAKSCYDQINKSLAMIACIAMGLPLLAAVMHNRTHHGMQQTSRLGMVLCDRMWAHTMMLWKTPHGCCIVFHCCELYNHSLREWRCPAPLNRCCSGNLLCGQWHAGCESFTES